MSFLKHIFKQSSIVESFKLPELIDGKEKRGLFDFLQDIRQQSRTDMEILRSWQRHFTGKNCPWALLLDDGVYVLWKIDEKATPIEIERIKEDPAQRWFREGTNIGYAGERF